MKQNLFEYKIVETKQTLARYLLQVHRIKLQDYIQCGLITPDRYLSDECEQDIQSTNPDFLVISDGYTQELDEYQILIELILTNEEKEQLIYTEGICYLNSALPITRIKKVYCQDKEIINWILINLATSEKGYLPKKVFEPYIKNRAPIFEKKESAPVKQAISSEDLSIKMRLFDKRMGMFAFMKNATLYGCNITQRASNYAENYFGMLSKYVDFNKEVTSHNEIFKLLSDKKNESFKNILYSDRQIDEEFMRSIYEEIEEPEAKEIFAELLENNKVLKTLPLLVDKGIYFYIGLIYYFRDKNSNKKDNFKTNIEEYTPYDKLETSLAFLGIYYGYNSLRADESIAIKDKYFKKLLDKERVNIKFKLDSKLDYITVETIYNYSFNDRSIKGFTYGYLDYPKKPTPIKFAKDKTFEQWYSVEQEGYFDIEHIKIKKQSFEEVVLSKLEKYNEDITPQKYYIFGYIFKYLPNIMKQDEKMILWSHLQI